MKSSICPIVNKCGDFLHIFRLFLSTTDYHLGWKGSHLYKPVAVSSLNEARLIYGPSVGADVVELESVQGLSTATTGNHDTCLENKAILL